MNAATQNSGKMGTAGGSSALQAVSHNLDEVDACGCPWSYTASLACSAKLNTRTQARSNKIRQKTGLKGRSGAVSGGISILIIDPLGSRSCSPVTHAEARRRIPPRIPRATMSTGSGIFEIGAGSTIEGTVTLIGGRTLVEGIAKRDGKGGLAS